MNDVRKQRITAQAAHMGKEKCDQIQSTTTANQQTTKNLLMQHCKI